MFFVRFIKLNHDKRVVFHSFRDVIMLSESKIFWVNFFIQGLLAVGNQLNFYSVF